MPYRNRLFALPLLFEFLACASADDEQPGAAPILKDAPNSVTQAGDSALLEVPSELALYPGAPFEDRRGGLWFSTVGGGLVRLQGVEFTVFTTADGLAGDSVRDVVEGDDGRLWIATTGGVSIYDGEGFTTLDDYGDLRVRSTFGAQGDHLDIWDIHRDRQGRWWIATLDGLFQFEGGQWIRFGLHVLGSAERSEFAPNMVYSIFEDADGAFWFATDGAGAVRYDGAEMVAYTERDGLCSDRVCEILQDSRGDYWFGTSDGGVSRWDGETFTTHLRSAVRSPHTGWGRCMAIHEDDAGNVWFGAASAGGGVHRWDGETFRYFSEDDGLGTGGVPSIRSDRSGNLWFGTTTGVYRLEGERFVKFAAGE